MLGPIHGRKLPDQPSRSVTYHRLANYYEFHNESVTVCEVVNYAPVNRTLAEPLDLCLGSSSSLNEEIYIENLVVAIVPIVANVWNMIHMDTFGRNFFLGK